MRAGGCPVVIAQLTEYWLHKPGVLVLSLATACLFTSSIFISKDLRKSLKSFQHEAAMHMPGWWSYKYHACASKWKHMLQLNIGWFKDSRVCHDSQTTNLKSYIKLCEHVYWSTQCNETRDCYCEQPIIRESVDSLCRDGADAQYMQYLSKSRITSPQIR